MTGPGIFRRSMLALGLAFLYAPLVLVVVYSFTASKLATVWAGFSTRWYVELASDTALLGAAWLSLKLAFVTATLALALGTLAGFALARYKRFFGRTLFAGLVFAPLAMPEIVMAISLLLLFVNMGEILGWPSERGFWTLVVAHVSFALSYVAVIVAGRLSDFDPTIEEAALDLGASPLKTFFAITLPVISPALAAGWLLAFSLSLDDVVTSQFVSAPGATPLPVVVLGSVKLGVSPKINAIGAIFIAILSLATLAAYFWQRRREELETPQRLPRN
ncbi:ABC transporter permease subunit [Rhodoblastus acidophilus]|uniref:ABC transporter permease subunit n=2 Tax=Candidatus Rhodoblastus alkanivorans TaxID=2954117 RepID=A0ABS9Z535_9HYPH|nr:ABC transporter permease subunit [Candidatus Rhodoblastus alkanivorans]MCI4682748.1 ABC transporter permease subunit [Candidatus Rhodoblastus alkanivorans]MDI4640055.1 ABC transporter permease subunit [Rhodoblastus acidophilus]